MRASSRGSLGFASDSGLGVSRRIDDIPGQARVAYLNGRSPEAIS